MHHKIQAVDKEKERLKDQVMKTGTVNYVKVINKQYGSFFTFLNIAKKNFIKGIQEKPIILLESTEINNINQAEIVTESIGDVMCRCPHREALIGYTDDNPENKCYKCGKNYRERVQEATSSVLYPIYILLTYTDSLMAKTIKAVTKQPYSHAGISLDSSLSHIFTYGRKTAEDVCKFTDENIFSGILGENKSKIQYALYVTFFNNTQIKTLKRHIENIKDDIKRHKYSYKGLINFAFGRETHDDGMFCSQFVASVIKAGDPRRLKRDISLYSPTDLRQVSGMHFVTRGILGNYNKAKVDETVEKIKANLVVTECNEIIDSVMPRIDERILDSQNDIVEFANIVNEYTDIIALKDTKNYLDNEFCKPIIDSRINKIISESTNISKEGNSMYIILETSQERLVNGKIIAFNPNDKDTKLYTVTEQVVDSAARFYTNKYSKSLNKVILEESNTDLPDNDDRVDVGFKIKANPETIGYITENFTNVKLSPNLHTGVVLDTRDSKFLVHYMSSVLESIGVSNVDIERYN